MGVLDIFSGETGRKTALWGAEQTQAGANQQRGYINTGAGLSLSALGGNQGGGYNPARAAVKTQYGVSRRDLSAGVGKAASALQGAGTQADAFYAPLGAEANRGYSAYGDAAGINGAAGQANARQNFQAGPGYEFMVNQGVNAAVRAANATGMGASGNTLDATTRLGANLADQEWDDYMAHLAPYLQLAPGIAGKRADIAQHTGDALGSLYQGQGQQLAGLSQGYGNTLASLGTGFGTNRAGIYGDQSRNLSNITGAETAAVTNQGQAGMLAGQTANQNTWNMGMQLANLAAGNADKVKNAFA